MDVKDFGDWGGLVDEVIGNILDLLSPYSEAERSGILERVKYGANAAYGSR